MSAAQIRELTAAAFGESAGPLAVWYAALLTANPALRTFTAENAAKIRKKARHASTADALRDLRCELAVAAALADRRSPLIYEPLAAEERRGPDFRLRHKAHTDVYVEVSRLRPATSAREPQERVASLLCGKLGQLMTGAANLLVLVRDDQDPAEASADAVLAALRQRAAARDDAYFAARNLSGARAFQQLLPRLSAVLEVAPASGVTRLLRAPQPRHQLPEDLTRAAAQWPVAATLALDL